MQKVKLSILGTAQALNDWTFATAEIGGKRFTIQFVRFDDPSQFGIDGGRISKLWIREDETWKTVANYDRGWDIRPTTAEAKAIVRAVMEQFN